MPKARTRDAATRLNSVTVHLGRALRRTNVGTELAAEQRSALSVVAFDGPLRMSTLAAEEKVSAGAITRTVDILARHGLVRRLPDPHDGRAQLIAATPAGKRTVFLGRDERERHVRRGLQGLSADGIRRITAALDDLEALTRILSERELSSGADRGRRAGRRPGGSRRAPRG